MLDDRHGLTVVTVVVGNEVTAIIGMQVLEAKFESCDEVLHEFDQSRQRFVLRRDVAYHLELGVVVGAVGHEMAVSARRARHGTQ